MRGKDKSMSGYRHATIHAARTNNHALYHAAADRRSADDQFLLQTGRTQLLLKTATPTYFSARTAPSHVSGLPPFGCTTKQQPTIRSQGHAMCISSRTTSTPLPAAAL
jgi:hypothetical protein